MEIEDIVVLVGGRGERLGKITDKIAAKKSKVKFYFKNNISLFKQVKNII